MRVGGRFLNSGWNKQSRHATPRHAAVYASVEFLSLLYALLRCRISRFICDMRFSSRSTESRTSTRCVWGLKRTSKGLDIPVATHRLWREETVYLNVLKISTDSLCFNIQANAINKKIVNNIHDILINRIHVPWNNLILLHAMCIEDRGYRIRKWIVVM